MRDSCEKGLPVDRTADVAVIGGGAVGTSIAYFLAKKNMDVVLVDKGGIAKTPWWLLKTWMKCFSI